MEHTVSIVGGGLAGSECALTLAGKGVRVRLHEMRPATKTPVHRSDLFAELVCSNSLKALRAESAAGMLKRELDVLGSHLYRAALETKVDAGGALAVDRQLFAALVTRLIEEHPLIEVVREEVSELSEPMAGADAVVIATGPLTSDRLACSLSALVGDYLAFFDAAAPIVLDSSLDHDVLFAQSRYEDGGGDYLNAPFDKEEYDAFIDALLAAERVMERDFESRDLFQACQPIEEIARRGRDAPRFGALKPVGLIDPRTGKRPWAVLQLRKEDAHGLSYNLVGFQTNLRFGEQERVFRMIPGLEHAEFARFGVMHRNTFVDAPRCIDEHGCLTRARAEGSGVPVYIAGQLSGTEGYCEAIRSGQNCAFSILEELDGRGVIPLPRETAFGSLMAHATDPACLDYQPMHVNFGIFMPLPDPPRRKQERYAAYARRGEEALAAYACELRERGIL